MSLFAIISKLHKFFIHIIAKLLFIIGTIFAIVAFGVVLIIAGYFWYIWHPRVVVPLQGTGLALVYQHRESLRSLWVWERLVLAKASDLTKPLADKASQVYNYRNVGGELWRSPDGLAYYLELQGGLHRIDIAERMLNPSLYPADICPSDTTTPKWPMEQIDPKRYPSRPLDFIFVGAIRGDTFTPADRLPPPAPPKRRRNCAAEALVWDGYASTTLDGTGFTTALRLRWLPGETLFYEFTKIPGWSGAWPSNSYPSPPTAAMPPRVRFSLYQDGDRIYFLEDGETLSLRVLNQRTRAGEGVSDRQRPACRIDVVAPSKEETNAAARPSRYFERWTWLGRFEARFEPMSGGRWGGDLVFLSPANASEDISNPDRFCDPTERRQAEQSRGEAAEEASEKERGAGTTCSKGFIAPRVKITPDGIFRTINPHGELGDCSSGR